MNANDLMDYFDQLQASVKPKWSRAEQLIQQASEKVFSQLDENVLMIEPISQEIKLHKQMSVSTDRTTWHTQHGNRKQLDLQLPEVSESNENLVMLRQKRAKRAEEKILQIKEQQHKRQLELKMGEQNYNEVLKQKPLFQVMHEKEQILIAESLQERKQKLDHIRDIRKPISRVDIQEHQRKIDDYRRDYAQKFSRDRTASPVSPQFERSQFYIRILQESEQKQLEEQEKKEQVIQLYRRKKKFSEDVKLKHLPTVSPEKQQELIDIRAKVHYKPDFQKYKKLAEVVRAKRISQPDSDCSQLHDQSCGPFESKPTSKVGIRSQQRSRNRNKTNPIFESRIKYIDDARKLEQQAVMQEQMAYVKGRYNQDVDMLLIGSIRAKLNAIQD